MPTYLQIWMHNIIINNFMEIFKSAHKQTANIQKIYICITYTVTLYI